MNLLDGTAPTVVSDVVPQGPYSKMEFEVENLDSEDDDSATARHAIRRILARLRQSHSSFPSQARTAVQGRFTPTGDAAQNFTVYFDAEIEIEKELATALRVPESAAVGAEGYFFCTMLRMATTRKIASSTPTTVHRPYPPMKPCAAFCIAASEGDSG